MAARYMVELMAASGPKRQQKSFSLKPSQLTCSGENCLDMCLPRLQVMSDLRKVLWLIFKNSLLLQFLQSSNKTLFYSEKFISVFYIYFSNFKFQYN